MLGFFFGGGLSANPRIEMSADTANANVGDLITFIAKPFDISGAVTQVVWKVDGATVSTITDFSAAVEYQTNQLTEGAHTITTETSYFSSKTGQVEIITKDLIAVISAVAQTVTSYAPAWESRYTLDLDENGWSILNPSFDSKIMYVDPDNGNDSTATPHTNMTLGGGTWDNPGSVSTYATLTAALAEAREGYPDYILMKRGSVLIHSSSVSFPSGRSLSERAVFGTYGNIADGRAVLDATNRGDGGYMVNNSTTDTNHWAMIGIHLTSSEQNPNDPSFLGWFQKPDYNGVLHLQDANPAKNILIEDCEFSYLKIAYYPTSDLIEEETPSNFILRRCVFHHNYSGNAILSNTVEGLYEENLHYRNGYWDDYDNMPHEYTYQYMYFTLEEAVSTDGITSLVLNDVVASTVSNKFGFRITDDNGKEHNIDGNVTYNGTSTISFDSYDFSSKPCSIGNQVRLMVNRGFWQHVVLHPVSDITGSAVTSIPITTSPYGDYPQGIGLTVAGTNGTLYEIPIDGIVGSTINIPSTDFSNDPVLSTSPLIMQVHGTEKGVHTSYLTKGKYMIIRNCTSIDPASIHWKLSAGGGNDALNLYSTSVYDNLMIGGDVGISAGGNGSSTTIPRFDRMEIMKNCFVDIGYESSRNAIRHRDIGWGYEHKDQQNSKAKWNIFTSRNTPSNSYALRVDNLSHGDEVTDNIGYGAGYLADSSGLDQDLVFIGNVKDHASHSSWLTIPQFLTSIGETGDVKEFAELLLHRRKGNWLTYDEDYKAALRASVAIDTPIVINQPTSYALGDGVTATFKFDAYTPYGTTFEWLDETNAVVAADSSRELDVVTSESTNGNQYKLRATLPDASTLDSNLATLTLENRQILTLTKVASGSTTNEPEIDLTFDGSDTITIAAGMSVKYTIGYTESISRMGVLLDSVTSNKVHHRWSGSVSVLGEDIDTGVVMSDGWPHKVTVRMPQAGQKHQVTVDGSMTEGTATHASGNSFTLSRIGLHKFGETGSSMFIYDVQIIDTDGETVLYQFDIANGAHSGATEPASIGNGFATMNVPASAWSS